MKIAVTGAEGFLGWHARCALQARATDEVVAIGRELAADPARLSLALSGVEAVLHLAGVNRAESDERLFENVSIAENLTIALDKARAHPTIVFANSTQVGNGTPFGQSKQAAAEHLVAWARRAGASVADVHLPNLFGEHGRPHYNSVVATFCFELANGGTPKIVDDRLLQLLHAQDAIDLMLGHVDQASAGVFQPVGEPLTVSALLDKLKDFQRVYTTGDIPDITHTFDRALFNTYRSFLFPGHYPFHPQLRSDERGDLFEVVRARSGQSQAFCSTTRPGATRGEHFHRRKVERFLVVQGEATISLRRLFDDRIIRLEVTGEQPAIVDMPTMWTHSIRNTGTTDLMTLFWADEIFDPTHTDTYREHVDLSRKTA